MTANACHVPGCVLAGFHSGRHRSATGQHFDQHQPATPRPTPRVVPTSTAPSHVPIAECGTRSGYGRHLRLGEPSCAACRAVEARYQRRRRLEAG